MFSSPPPGILAIMPFVLYYIPLFNLACLIFSVVYWRRAEVKLLMQSNPQCLSYTKDQLRSALQRRRVNYFHSLDLPRFIQICPLKIAVDRTRGPSLGPFVTVLLAQSIPGIAVFAAFWYFINGSIDLMHGALHAFRLFTPIKVKQVLFFQWF